MKCQNCNKNNATVRYTQIINGKKTEMNLCENCSNELGINNYNFNMPINFSSFLSDFMDEYNIPSLMSTKKLQCDKCNMSYEEFLNIGKFGCSNCYSVFSNKIDNVLKKINGGNRYIGNKSIPVNEDVSKQENIKNNKLADLKRQLKEYIKTEEYEKAAIIRDKIKELEGSINNE